MKPTKFNIVLLIFLCLFFSRTVAQYTNLSVTISEKNFPERSDWGESLRITKLEFWVNDNVVGSFYGELASPENSALTHYDFDLSSSEVRSRIVITYIHHEWNMWGDWNTTGTYEYPLNPLNLYGSGTTDIGSFNQFIDLPMAVSWSFNYQITITPFKPQVNNANEKICYHHEKILNLTPEGTDIYTNPVQYEWQYGYFSKQWSENPSFRPFITEVANALSSDCTGGPELNCSNIAEAVAYTDYSFMKDYESLYDNPGLSEKYEITNHLLNGILSSQAFLSYTEQNYLQSNFINVMMQKDLWYAPYISYYAVASWSPFGLLSESQIIFRPEELISPSTQGITRIAFRVRAISDEKASTFQGGIVFDVSPKAPEFTITTEPSCKGSSTGVAIFSGVSGVVSGYKAVITEKNTDSEGNSVPVGVPEIFYGSEHTFNQKLPVGEYNFDVYYSDEGITNCSISQPKTVGQEKELSFTFSATDATCPEKTDGKININIIQYADYNKGPSSCNIQLGSARFNTTGTFTGLDNQTYDISISDFCASKTQAVEVGELNVVNVSISEALDPACKSAPDGSIISVASGSANNFYDFELYEGSRLIRSVSPAGSSYKFEALPGGNYTVKARSNLCTAFLKSDQKSLAPVQDIDFTAMVTDVMCFGESTGAINLSATGGKPGYFYQLGSKTYTNESVFNSLIAGTYQVSVRTGTSGCDDLKSKFITVNSASKIQIGLDAVNASCFEKDDGTIKAIISGGSGVYSYSWQEYTGAGWYLKPGNSEMLGSLYAGRYRINVTDSYNCLVSAEGIVSEPPLLAIESAIPKDVVCYGGKGNITITASGGLGTYEYSCQSDAGQVYKSSLSRLDLPEGSYYVSVKDAHNCEAVFDDYAKIHVTSPPSPLDFIFSSPEYHGYNLKCKGDNSGSLNIVASGGNGAGYLGYKYSVTGTPEKTDGSFTGLSAGSYNIKVTDGRGCVVQKLFDLTEPSQLNIAIVSTENVKCYGASTGEIRVAASGGISGTYKYTLDGTEMLSPGIFNNLYADTYRVGVSDINGCTSDLFATVQSLNPPIGIVMIPEDVRCFGENNGKISTIVSGGSGGFTYLWETDRGSGWQAFGSASGSLTDLVPAKYRIRVTDSENCNASHDSEIKEPSRVIVSGATPKDVVCFGGTGSMSIAVSGGSPVYTYYCREKGGTVYDSPLSELQLPAGVFTVSVKDSKGCQASYAEDISITAPASSLDFTANLSSYNGFNVSCNGKNDGFLIAESTGGNGPGYSGYKYSVNGSPDATDNRFSNLAKGLYVVRVMDARGCKVEKTFSLNEPEPLVAEILNSNPVKCFGESTGEFSVGVSGGIQNSYKFRLDGQGDFTTGAFKDLYPGSYTVDVTDLNGCSKTIQTTVTNKNPQISTQLTSSPARCYGENNGAITSIVTGGAGGFIYSWQKKTVTGWQGMLNQSHSAASLTAGYYRLILRDADNCPAKDSIAVTEPSLLEISKLSIIDAICFDDKGNFQIEAQGGNGGYSYYVSGNGGTTYDSYNPGNMLIPAVYRIKVKDTKGCELTEPESHSISKPDKPLDFSYDLSRYGDYNISCHGNNDGSVTLLPSGGNDYGYSGYRFLNKTNLIEGTSMSKLEAGSYELSVIDGRGCMITKTVALSEPASIMKLKVAELEQPKCAYDRNGSVTLFAEGGNFPYEYSVNGNLFGTSAAFYNLEVASYHFRVRDANGCSEILDTSLMNAVSEMKVSGIISDAKCFGENSGSVEVHVYDGAQPYTYRWKDNSSISPSRSSLFRGDYVITVTDAAGCISEKGFSVKEPVQPLRISAVTMPACAELKDGVIRAAAEGGTEPYFFAVDKRSDFRTASQFDVFSGNHTVYVSDSNNCLSEASVTVGVKNIKPDINFMLATSRFELDTLVIIDVSVPAPDKVKWEFPQGTIVIDTTAHKAMIKYNQSGLYPVKMTGSFGACTYAIDKLLNISPFDPLTNNEDRDRTGIKSLILSPNPNDGNFTVNLELYTKLEVVVRIFDFYSRILLNEKWPADISFKKEINLPGNALPGNYVLWIITEKDSRPVIFIISR